jgi:hypothetical protein
MDNKTIGEPLVKPVPLDDERIFRLTRERWPGARAVARTKGACADFRVSSRTPNSAFEIERVERKDAIEFEGSLIAYAERAQMIVVFA